MTLFAAHKEILPEDGNRPLTPTELEAALREIGARRYAEGRFPEATTLFLRLATAVECQEFLTLPAYDLLDSPTSSGDPS